LGFLVSFFCALFPLAMMIPPRSSIGMRSIHRIVTSSRIRCGNPLSKAERASMVAH
jgi:hypothetical protein